MRITKNMLAEQVRDVQAAAERNGLEFVDYSRSYRFADLRVDDYGLVAISPVNGSMHRVKGGTNTEIMSFMSGILFALSTAPSYSR